MSDFKNIMRIAAAVVGVVVGAGFASGQETMQFFSSFGYIGLLGAIISGLLFTLLCTAVGDISRVKVSTSYKEGIYLILGPFLGLIMDILITFFMFAIAAVMFAGGGSLLEQQWGIPAQIGGIAVMVITVLLVCMPVERVITFIGSVTPLLVVLIIIISAYAWFTPNVSIEELNEAAQSTPRGASNWIMGALLYVSYNMFVGGPFLMIAGGLATSRRNAIYGGLIGGAILGILILLIGSGVFARINDVGSAAIPTLTIASEISPVLGILMAIVIFLMILNTAVGVLYSFAVRIIPSGTNKFKIVAAVSGIVAYVGAQFGFINLVGTVYPFFGYIGFVLILAILISWWRILRTK